MEFLIQLQYCQEIKHQVIDPSQSLDPTSKKAILFFPALCIAERSEVLLISPSDFNYGIGWMARCSDHNNFFPPRFLHVLLLRLVKQFTLPVGRDEGESDHSHRCSMWKTGVHWLMEEDVECMVELIASGEVVVTTKSKKEFEDNCISVFNQIVTYVMDTKADFCSSVKPDFFLLDPLQAENGSSNLFAMRDVEKIMASERLQAVISVNGKGRLERSRLLGLRQFTFWNTLFPVDLLLVHNYLADVIHSVEELGLNLGIPPRVLETIKKNFPNDITRCRAEVIKEWMNSQDPPSWWHLVQALRSQMVEEGAIANKIERELRTEVEVQKMLEEKSHKPDEKFLEQFADIVDSKWPSLATILSLTSSEVEEVRDEGEGEEVVSERDLALLMLKKWSSKEEATYGLLCQRLKTISLFHYASQ